MQVTRVELFRSTTPVSLPEPWRAAWRGPGAEPVTEFDWSLVRVHTDSGVVGIGPGVGDPRAVAIDGMTPFRVGEFWDDRLGGERAGNAAAVAGLEIALWDAVGKAAGRPVRDLLGAVRDRVPVYAATSRLQEPEALVAQVRDIRDQGFEAVKLRAHRPDPTDDVDAVRAVRDAVGDEYTLFVDANQNNAAKEYAFWSRHTARRVASDLDDLGVAFLEEPRPRRDVEGLADIADRVDMAIAGGEHSVTPRDFRPHLQEGAYEVLQPDVLLGGHMGIEGLRRTTVAADLFDGRVIPHVTGNATTAIGLAATLQVAGAEPSVPMVEYPYDPPILTPETTQPLIEDPIRVGDDGRVAVPDGPGLGIDLDDDVIEDGGEIVWRSA